MRFRQAPLAAAALWFAAGIGVERWRGSGVPVPLELAALVVLAGLAGLALWRAQRVAWVPVAGVWFALGIAAAMWHMQAPQPVALMGYADNLSRSVVGTVVRVRTPPVHPQAQPGELDAVAPWESAEDNAGAGKDFVTVDLAVEAVEDVTPETSSMAPVTGGVRVSVFGEALPFACGQRIEVPLRMKLPGRYRDPGVYQYADTLAAAGIVARASVAAEDVALLGAASPTLACRLGRAQAWASGRLLAFAASPENTRLPKLLRLSEPDAAMLNAMLFGDRTGLSHGLRVGFERTGSFHLFVVSGMHIALLAGAVWWALRRLRVWPWLASLLTLSAATAYAALTGFGQPSQRALGMTAVFLLTRLLAREHDRMPLNALGAAALAMLIWSPGSLFEASFQMTVLAIVAIAGIAIPLGEWSFLRYARVTREVFHRHGNQLPPREAQLRMMLELWGEGLGRFRRVPALLVRWTLLALELALIATVAELVLALPMAMYFHRAAIFALPANMVVVPLIAVLAPVAVVTFCAALLSPWLAIVPGAMTALLLHAITAGIRHLSGLAVADVRVPGPVWWGALIAGAGWLACCWLVRRGRMGALAAALLVPVIAVAVLSPEPAVRQPGTLEITALDVGQGDSLLAVNPEGGSMLIDAGGPVGGFGVAEVVSNFDVGEEVVSPYLWSRRMRRVDVVVLTHAHTDHMGGMPAVLNNFRPRELWVGADPASPLFTALLAEAARLGIVVRHVHAGERIAWGSVGVTVLAPATSYVNAGAPKNDDSVVLRMDLGKASALLEGDAERPSEDAMVGVGLAPATLLKVGHHGSRTSSSAEFLAQVQPRYAVVSDGRGNTFGHPRREVLERMAAAGTHLYRTDQMGLTTFLLRPDGSVKTVTGAAESDAIR